MQAMPASFLHLCCACVFACMITMFNFALSFAVYADGNLSVVDNVKRLSLVKQAVRAPQSLSIMDKADIEILLRDPAVKRDELVASAWHYHGESCALDIYFSDQSVTPSYIEFRALSLNDGINAEYEQSDEATWNDQCLRDVLQAQGVDTPASYATRPLPSWDSPYRS